jgi:GT2 family glycosyltransferase
MQQEISIVILNWNGRKYLEKFLPNVIEHSPKAKIIVADNNSTDNSIEFLSQNFPQIEIIKNETNGGFAKGYNDALKHVHSKYYLLLNSDIEVTEGWLNPLLNTIEAENVAACQPKILAYNNKKQFEHAGASGGFLDRNYYPFCRGRILDQTEIDYNQYDYKQEIFWASGACLLIKADLFHKLEGFDEDFFAHMEEIDLCWRLKKLGYKIEVNPESVVYHVGGGTLNYMSPFKTYLNFRNSLFMILKNHEGIYGWKIVKRLFLDGLAGILFLAQGNPKHTLAVIRAHFSFYKLFSKMLKKRNLIKKNSTKFNAIGLYKGNILWAKYFKKINAFSKLNLRLFSDY